MNRYIALVWARMDGGVNSCSVITAGGNTQLPKNSSGAYMSSE